MAGHEVVILGRGATIGRPLAMLLAQKRPTANAAVTVVHTGVPDWARYTRRADILVAAAGVPGIIQPEHVRPGATVIGAGVRYAGRRLLPDVDESVAEVAGAITPRVGGVGPTTVAMLFRNAIAAAERQWNARVVRGPTDQRCGSAAEVRVLGHRPVRGQRLRVAVDAPLLRVPGVGVGVEPDHRADRRVRARPSRRSSVIQSALVRPPRSTAPTSVIIIGLRAVYVGVDAGEQVARRLAVQVVAGHADPVDVLVARVVRGVGVPGVAGGWSSSSGSTPRTTLLAPSLGEDAVRGASRHLTYPAVFLPFLAPPHAYQSPFISQPQRSSTGLPNRSSAARVAADAGRPGSR